MQTNLYDFFEQPKWDKPLRVCELYGGIGSQLKALKNIGATISEHYLVEIDINATISYASIHCGLNNHLNDDVPSKEEMIRQLEPYGWWHNEKPKDIRTLPNDKLKKLYLAQQLSNNYGNVMNLDDLPPVDLITWSTPCQDFSNAGKKAGFEGNKGNLTSVTINLFKKLTYKPTFLLFENVPMIVSQKFKQGFDAMLEELHKLGYDNIVMKLNAKDYGIPQNRDRIFVLSIRHDYEANYSPPQPIPLQLRLKDMLEETVHSKYYLTENQLLQIQNAKFDSMKIDRINTEDGVCNTITTMGGGHREPMIASPINSREYRGFQDIAPTLCARDYKDPKWVTIPEATTRGYAKAYEGDGVYINRPHQKRGTVQKNIIQTINTAPSNEIGVVVNGFYKQALDTAENNEIKHGDVICTYNETVDRSGVSPTITTRPEGKKTAILPVMQDLRIRKLTPLETWRLMGFTDEDYYNAEPHNSNSALYKQAGNSIVVQVLEKIFERII
jgi:DNA (cytosine-5)-methyltransferase 1